MKAEILLKHSYRRKAVKDSESLLTCSDLQTERYINMTNSGESSSENCVSSNGNESDEDADGSSFPSSASDVDKEPCSNRTSETKYICDETDETIEAEKLRSADLDNSPLHKHSFEDHGTIMTPSYLSLNINGQAIGSVSTDQAEHSMDGQTATLRKSPGTHSRAHSSEVLPLNMVKTPTKATKASFSGASCISYTSIDSPAGSPEHLRPHLMATISPSVLNLSTSALLDGVPVSPLMSPPVSLSHPCLDLAADDVSVLQANPGNPSYLRLFSADGESLLPSTEVYGCKWMQCDRKFSSMDALVYHVNDQHVKVERPDVDYQCKWNGCPRKGRGFNARYKMLIHIRTHTNEKPHKCASCGKCFSRLENLKIHNRSHTGERPYVCPFEGCGKAYSNSSDRFKHVRTHSEEKPYICKMQGCNKRYTDPSSLRKHVRTHGHYYRENEKHSVSKTSCNVSSANSVIENSRALNLCPMTQVLLPVTTGPVLKSQNLITPPSLLSGSSIPRMMTVSPSFQKVVSGPSYTSNPLLSSTILVTPQIKAHSDGITTPHSSPIKLELGPEAGSHDQEKCQDGPLDLSTSTQSDQDTDLVVEEHDSAGFSSTKWDLLH